MLLNLGLNRMLKVMRRILKEKVNSKTWSYWKNEEGETWILSSSWNIGPWRIDKLAKLWLFRSSGEEGGEKGGGAKLLVASSVTPYGVGGFPCESPRVLVNIQSLLKVLNKTQFHTKTHPVYVFRTRFPVKQLYFKLCILIKYIKAAILKTFKIKFFVADSCFCCFGYNYLSTKVKAGLQLLEFCSSG